MPACEEGWLIFKSHNVRKRTFKHVCPAKIQIILRIRVVWSEFSLGAFWIIKDAEFLHAENEESDQTVRRWAHIQKVRFFPLRLI